MTNYPQARNQGDTVPRINIVMKCNFLDHKVLSHMEKVEILRKGNKKTRRADDETEKLTQKPYPRSSMDPFGRENDLRKLSE